MKLNSWLLLGTLFSTALFAQTATNTVPATALTPPAPLSAQAPASAPAAVTPATTSSAPAKPTPARKAPAKKATAKKAPARKPVTLTRTVPLVPGPATVTASNVNVRAQARLSGEVIGKLSKGQGVTVIEEILLSNSAANEPSVWAKIALPEGISVWVHNDFYNPNSKTVTAPKLNLRAGPGENFSVLGRVERGAVLQDIVTRGDWTQIEAPKGAYAFVAAAYLKQEAGTSPALLTSTTPPAAPSTVLENPASPATVQEPPTLAAAPSATPPSSASSTLPMITIPPENAAATNSPAEDEFIPEDQPLPPRIVMREGIVRGSSSVQAPSHFELISLDNGKLMNYLVSDSTDLDLRRYKGLHIIVTGEEGLDKRWRRTPVLTIQRLEVLE